MKTVLKRCFLWQLVFVALTSHGQKLYYPDTSWQVKKPGDLKLNSQWIDSAVRFAQQNEVKLDYDLRVANLKSYANEQDYKILGPVIWKGWT